MKKININLFVVGAILTLALFGCNSGKKANTTAAGALIDGAALYNSDCGGCHGSLAKSGKRGVSVTQIQDAISHNWGGMGAFAILTADQLQAIATALSAPVTTTPDTTTATNPPTSSTDSLDGAALYTNNCQNCHNPLATSSKAGRTATQIQEAIAGNYGGMGRFSSLTIAQLQAIADALSTVPAPAPVQTPSSTSGTTSASPDGAALYTTYCNSCHGALATSSKRGATAARIQTAVTSVSAMRSLSSLTSAQIQAIAAALGAAPASTPSSTPASSIAPSTSSNSVDGASLYATYCQGCHQPLASSTKAGRTATQIQAAIGSVGAMSSFSNLTSAQIQAIASALAAPASGTTSSSGGTSTSGGSTTSTDGAALYATYCQGCHQPLASSTKAGRTATQIQVAIGSVGAMSSFSNLTSAQIQAIATALAAPGSTSTSSSGGTTSSSGGTTSSTDGAVLYTTYCSSCHGSLAASSKAGRTAAQIQTAIGSVGNMSSLSSLTATQIQVIATALATAPTPAPTDGAALYTSYCNSCHGALASSSVHGSSASTISSALSSVSQMRSISLTTTQIQAIAAALGTTPAPTTTTVPGTIDGAALYTQYCSGCHGSDKQGTSVSSIQGAISSVSQMKSLSLTSVQIQAISTGSTVPAPTTILTPAPGTIDGAALYTTYCSGCHGPLATSGHRGATVIQILTGINTISGMMPFSTLTVAQLQAISDALNSTTPTATTTPTTFVCGSCHAVPPATGHHSLHVGSVGLSCGTCHGTGYSSTTVNAATHANGVVNIATTPGWNPTTRSCSNSCHGSHSW